MDKKKKAQTITTHPFFYHADQKIIVTALCLMWNHFKYTVFQTSRNWLRDRSQLNKNA